MDIRGQGISPMCVSEQMIGRRLCCATIAIHLTLLGPLAVTGADGLAEELVLPLARGRAPYRALSLITMRLRS